MNLRELLLVGLVLWTVVGVIGTTVLLLRGEKAKAVRGAVWIVGVWVAYLGIVAGVSLIQRQKVVAMGQEQCFDDMCFAVTGAEEVQGLLIRDGSRLLRVTVRVRNRGRGRAQSEKLMRAYLVDGQRRKWEESAGVGGVPLTARVAAGDSVVSQPVFKIAKDATGLGLIFTHGWKQPGVLVIGGSDSFWHRRTIVWLGM